MSDYLPARHISSTPGTTEVRPSPNGSSRLRDWLYSPVGRAVADVLPDVLRLASRRQSADQHSIASRVLPSSDGANGMTVSEVEVDIDAPFIRRVIIRSASSWSVAPEVIESEKRSRRGRIGLRALTVGALGVAGFIFARRSGFSLPLPASLSLPDGLSRTRSTPAQPQTKNPGEVD